MRIIEFYSALWGGAYNIIVPTDGRTIDERFWTILETFDPDYLFRYQKSGEDLRLNDPERYEQILQSYVDRAVREGGDADSARTETDKQLRNSWESHFGIEQQLQEELKRRLAPFWFEQYAVDAGAIGAGSTPDFHLTQLSNIILNSEHPNAISVLEVPDALVPKLWCASVTGLASPTMLDVFQQLGITRESFPFREDNIGVLLELVITGEVRRAQAAHPGSTAFSTLAETTPFNISMLQLGLYRSTRYTYWTEPLLLVAGNTFEDFCLYYCLSRLRDRVVWVLPSVTEKALNHSANQTLTRAETHFLFKTSNAERSSRYGGGTACTTYSLGSAQIDSIITWLEQSGTRQFASKIRQMTDVEPLIRLPLVPIERDNFQRDVPVQLSDDWSMSPFNTPKPKHFQPIHPYEHRWITQLSIAGHAPPKHYKLGTWTVPDPRLSTEEARISREGPAYFCPNTGYFGGDIDTVLVRPRLRLSSLSSLLEELSQQNGYECRLSDKGVYAEESVSKWGDLQQIAAFLRRPQFRAMLNQYLDKSGSEPGKGVYLNDKRRYLDFGAIEAIVGKGTEALIDELITKKVLYRGFVFGCAYCKDVAWFSIAEITQEFQCRRCGRKQTFTKPNWRMPEEPRWFYKLDELVYLGFSQGMTVSLLALDHLRVGSESSFTFSTDREFWRPGAQKPDVEADFFCVPDGVLTIGEAKKESTLGASQSEEAEKIRKYKRLATELCARQVVFATLSPIWNETTVTRIKAAFVEVPSVRLRFLDASNLLSPAQEMR